MYLDTSQPPSVSGYIREPTDGNWPVAWPLAVVLLVFSTYPPPTKSVGIERVECAALSPLDAIGVRNLAEF